MRTPTVSLLSLLQVPSRDEAYFSSVAPSVLCCLYFHPVYRHSLLARNGKKGAIFDLKVLHELLLLAKGEEPVAENRILTVVVPLHIDLRLGFNFRYLMEENYNILVR